MKRDPERCEFREPLAGDGDRRGFACGLVRQILGTPRQDAAHVRPEACLECCGFRLPASSHLNPVIASLVYKGAKMIAEDRDATWREREEAVRSQQFVVDQLEVLRGGPLTTARALSTADTLAATMEPPTALGKVGLVGWNTASGLGYMNRDIATHLPIEKWLVPKHSVYRTLDPPPTQARVDTVGLEIQTAEIKAWLRGLDWVLFVELPYFPLLAHCAHEMGIQVACVPMWELACLQADWLRLCDLMVCTTRFAYELLCDWKRRFDFGWKVVELPWPIDTGRFRFRRRTRCERFLFVNGTGGCGAFRGDGKPVTYRRKGMEILLPAARLLRPIPFLVYSQVEPDLPIPDNVELRLPPDSNSLLYAEADICVQPSRWEGLGLQMLECQAAGLPLVTTEAPPMNEYRPLRTVPARETEPLWILGRHAMTSHNVAPEDLAATLKALYRTDISEASRRARSFIEEEHSWEKALPLLIRALARCDRESRGERGS